MKIKKFYIIIVALLLFLSLGAVQADELEEEPVYYTLCDLPEPFVIDSVFGENTVVVVGDDAPDEDLLAAEEILYALNLGTSTSDIKLDSEITNPEDYNLIIVGTVCNNYWFEDFGSPCGGWPFSGDIGAVALKENGDNYALIVVGDSEEDTEYLGSLVADYTSNDFCGRNTLVEEDGDLIKISYGEVCSCSGETVEDSSDDVEDDVVEDDLSDDVEDGDVVEPEDGYESDDITDDESDDVVTDDVVTDDSSDDVEETSSRFEDELIEDVDLGDGDDSSSDDYSGGGETISEGDSVEEDTGSDGLDDSSDSERSWYDYFLERLGLTEEDDSSDSESSWYDYLLASFRDISTEEELELATDPVSCGGMFYLDETTLYTFDDGSELEFAYIATDYSYVTVQVGSLQTRIYLDEVTEINGLDNEMLVYDEYIEETGKAEMLIYCQPLVEQYNCLDIYELDEGDTFETSDEVLVESVSSTYAEFNVDGYVTRINSGDMRQIHDDEDSYVEVYELDGSEVTFGLACEYSGSDPISQCGSLLELRDDDIFYYEDEMFFITDLDATRIIISVEGSAIATVEVPVGEEVEIEYASNDFSVNLREISSGVAYLEIVCSS